MAGAVEDDASAEVAPATRLRQCTEQHLDVRERMVGEPATGEFRADAVLAAPGIGEVDQPVAGEIGMQGDVEQPALADGGEVVGQAVDRARVERAVRRHQPQTPRAFADQHASVGQEGEAPGVLEAAREHGHTQIVEFAAFDTLRRRRQPGERREQAAHERDGAHAARGVAISLSARRSPPGLQSENHRFSPWVVRPGAPCMSLGPRRARRQPHRRGWQRANDGAVCAVRWKISARRIARPASSHRTRKSP